MKEMIQKQGLKIKNIQSEIKEGNILFDTEDIELLQSMKGSSEGKSCE